MAKGIISELTDELAISFLALQHYPVDQDVIDYLNERSKADDEFLPLVEVLTFRGGIPYKENLKVLEADNAIELVKDALKQAYHFESLKKKSNN
ncbi:hypothetical protein [Pseudoalteromonas phenolica]|uniref:hypothetical protein n=1 Tax=Pseudoalteromonas phenolica TaxID=161398 RepID=UPI000FFE7244|nr:hypothetical protein [Pseudoalteromonas phenolica]RXF04935.1 hypothetical protein D9981_03470 [Pseudoalteromonas phenolica O-BC30]